MEFLKDRFWYLFYFEILFTIDLFDLFLIINYEDIANYAEDNTTYVPQKNIDEVVIFLEKSSRVIFKWFSDNKF